LFKENTDHTGVIHWRHYHYNLHYKVKCTTYF